MSLRSRGLTLWQVWWDIRHFLGVDMRPVKVIVRVLLVIALIEALVKCTASCKDRKTISFSLPHRMNDYWQNEHRLLTVFSNKSSDSSLSDVFLCVTVSQLINKPPGARAPTAITQSLSGSPLTQTLEPSADHLSPSPRPRDPHVWAGRLWHRLALIQRDATCPQQLLGIIKSQWYVACTGYISDGNSIPATASYLIHWPASAAQLALIKWPGEGG